ncbi:Uncharacterized protein FKW44_021385, partial [Caligus rogercresseyi]
MRLVGILLSNAKNTFGYGAKQCKYQINRGCLQGDPSAPLLFIIATDPLLRQLSEIEGIDVKAYADDTTILTTGN